MTKFELHAGGGVLRQLVPASTPRPSDAEAELEGGAAFYEERVPGLGIDFLDEVEQAIDEVCERPLAHPLWPDLPRGLGVRRKLLRRFPSACHSGWWASW